MNLEDIKNKAKSLIGQRGGVESVKEDAEELRDIATSEGSLGDKAKQAADALKDPGRPGQ